jgi:hypothetical protein
MYCSSPGEATGEPNLLQRVTITESDCKRFANLLDTRACERKCVLAVHAPQQLLRHLEPPLGPALRHVPPAWLTPRNSSAM